MQSEIELRHHIIKLPRVVRCSEWMTLTFVRLDYMLKRPEVSLIQFYGKTDICPGLHSQALLSAGRK